LWKKKLAPLRLIRERERQSINRSAKRVGLFRVLEKGRGRGQRRWRVWFWFENRGGEERTMKDATSPNFGLTKKKQGSNRSLKRIGVKHAASPIFLAEIEISFRLKKGIVMAENERGGKMNRKRMGVTE
jgi:hypothetical protein